MGKLIHIRSLKSPTSVTFVDSRSTGANSNSYDFTGINFGVADLDRYIVAACGNRTASAGSDITSVTIAGVAATRIANAKASGSGISFNSSLWIAAIPTGTSGTISMTHGGNEGTDIGLSVYRLISISSPTPSDTDNLADINAGTSISMDLDIPGPSSVAIGAMCCLSNASSTWSGLTEDRDSNIDNISFSSASAKLSAAETARAISCTLSAAKARAACCAVWSPS